MGAADGVQAAHHGNGGVVTAHFPTGQVAIGPEDLVASCAQAPASAARSSSAAATASTHPPDWADSRSLLSIITMMMQQMQQKTLWIWKHSS